MAFVFNVTAVTFATVLSLSICTQAKAAEKKYFACVATVYGFEKQRMNSGNKPKAYFYSNVFEGRMADSRGWWRYQDAFETSLYAQELKGRTDVQSVVSHCTSDKVRNDTLKYAGVAARSAAVQGAKGWETPAELPQWLPDEKLHAAVEAEGQALGRYSDDPRNNARMFSYCYTRGLRRASKLLVLGGLEKQAFAAKAGVSESDAFCSDWAGTPEGAKYLLRRNLGPAGNYERINWPVTEADFASIVLPKSNGQASLSKQLTGIIVSFDEKPSKALAPQPAAKPKQQAAAENKPSTAPRSAPPKQDCYAMMARGEKCSAAQ